MKKIAMLFACLLCAGMLTANAEGLIVKAGANFTSIESMDSKPFAGQFGVGFQTEIPDGIGFSFQPELVYKLVGFEYDKESMKRGYIEVPLNVQLGFNIGNTDNLHPFVFAGPYIGVGAGVFGDKKAELTKDDVLSKVEYGLGVGVGIDLWILQLTAKYNWNLNTLSKASGSDFEGLREKPHIIEICVGIRF